MQADKYLVSIELALSSEDVHFIAALLDEGVYQEIDAKDQEAARMSACNWRRLEMVDCPANN